jgi:hypothetical protein
MCEQDILALLLDCEDFKRGTKHRKKLRVNKKIFVNYLINLITKSFFLF